MVNFHSYVNVYQRVYESPTRWWSYPTHPTQIATWIGTLMIHLFNFQTNHEAQKEIFNLSKRAVATRQNHGKLMDGLDGWKPQVFGRYDGDVISNDLWLYIYIYVTLRWWMELWTKLWLHPHSKKSDVNGLPTTWYLIAVENRNCLMFFCGL